MDERAIQKVTDFIRPLYQDLDGASRMDEIDRVATIARRLHRPDSPADEVLFELVLRFHGLRKWLEGVGNFSRTVLALHGVVDESIIGEVLRSLRRLPTPESPGERAVAAAILIDEAGAQGLARKFSSARRMGSSIEEVAREVVSNEEPPPDWMTEEACDFLARRRSRAKRICEEVLAELSGSS